MRRVARGGALRLRQLEHCEELAMGLLAYELDEAAVDPCGSAVGSAR